MYKSLSWARQTHSIVHNILLALLAAGELGGEEKVTPHAHASRAGFFSLSLPFDACHAG